MGDFSAPVGQSVSALEEEAGAADRSFVIERVQRPADPEVFLDMVDWRTETVGSREKKVKAIGRCRSADLSVGSGGHGRTCPASEATSRSRRNSCIQIGSTEKPASNFGQETHGQEGETVAILHPAG